MKQYKFCDHKKQSYSCQNYITVVHDKMYCQ